MLLRKPITRTRVSSLDGRAPFSWAILNLVYFSRSTGSKRMESTWSWRTRTSRSSDCTTSPTTPSRAKSLAKRKMTNLMVSIFSSADNLCPFKAPSNLNWGCLIQVRPRQTMTFGCNKTSRMQQTFFFFKPPESFRTCDQLRVRVIGLPCSEQTLCRFCSHITWQKQ